MTDQATSQSAEASETPSILIVGDGGTEKTRFLAQWPKIYIFDFDAGMRSAREFKPTYATFKDAPWHQRTGVGVNPALGIYEWGTAWPKFITHLNETIWPRLEKGDWEYGAIGIDSLTTLANISMNYVLKGSGKTGSATPEIQHWGSQLRLLETVMEQLAAWPIPLLVTAHIKRDDNLVSGEREYLPLVGGQLGGKIGIYFDEVYYTQPSGTGVTRKIKIKTEAGGLHKMAKSRYHVPDGTELKYSEIAKILFAT